MVMDEYMAVDMKDHHHQIIIINPSIYLPFNLSIYPSLVSFTHPSINDNLYDKGNPLARPGIDDKVVSISI